MCCFIIFYILIIHTKLQAFGQAKHTLSEIHYSWDATYSLYKAKQIEQG